MKLGTEGIRIVAPLPNKTTVGVEVPNKIKEAVVMRELVEAIDPAVNILPMILGRDAVGKPLVTDLAKCPHLLVAGSTGMGKSVCMNAMICSILLFRTPDEVRFIMVDPKMVELAGYEDIPHLLAPPITDMTKAHAALEWACQVMDQRYEALKATGCRNISDYNQLGIEEIRARLDKKRLSMDDLPEAKDRMYYIVILVDEYADLMMVNKEVEKSIVRLAAKSRACGLHVILTTQRPSADVVTGLIKSNLPSRICFRVVDKNNSRVVLDVSGAENLLGKGDMLFLQPGTSSPVRGQGVWLKDSEINAIVEHAKKQGRPEYNEDVVKVGAVAQEGGGSGGKGAGGEWVSDRGFHDAVQSMYRYNKTGADFFRRKLGIGYNKATAYVEQLEDLGFVGEQKSTAPREILKSWDDWIELLKENGVTWEEGDDLYRNPASLGDA
jgi:S-DNA-T family DNA segregation ATPase FtsK/SpoIIIE